MIYTSYLKRSLVCKFGSHPPYLCDGRGRLIQDAAVDLGGIRVVDPRLHGGPEVRHGDAAGRVGRPSASRVRCLRLPPSHGGDLARCGLDDGAHRLLAQHRLGNFP